MDTKNRNVLRSTHYAAVILSVEAQWRYDSCRYLTTPLGHLIYVSTEARHLHKT